MTDLASTSHSLDPDLPWQPLPGGWSGETFLSRTGGEAHVVRIYAPERPRRPDAAEVDAALSRLVGGLVPVPRVVEQRPAKDGHPALMVTEFVPGRRADDVLRAALDADDVATLDSVGRALGAVAGRLAGMPTLRRGRFSAPDLVVVADPAHGDVHARVTRRLGELRGWSESELDALERVAERAQDLLDEEPRTCLVHGDLNPKNVVLAGDGSVAAVVDWEYAHAGSPHEDLGDLLRFDRHPAWEQAVLHGWTRERGGDPALARDLARASDLAALVELTVRPGGNLVVDLAEVFLREIARTGDWHAHP
ncbi:phosphotransferase [Nocardioides yefusunii]|uniref:Phosphotransferase n=1 Tax=Nocardioides yefusunii TaxID=2500546 RepID=A0ABW1QXY4_9ACTN|nr:phosphotransferase [Nocardioides yefusunii]